MPIVVAIRSGYAADSPIKSRGIAVFPGCHIFDPIDRDSSFSSLKIAWIRIKYKIDEQLDLPRFCSLGDERAVYIFVTGREGYVACVTPAFAGDLEDFLVKMIGLVGMHMEQAILNLTAIDKGGRSLLFAGWAYFLQSDKEDESLASYTRGSFIRLHESDIPHVLT
ncbi:hypothetical protein F1880_004536 [Penicillium rolfsii]|nr:hypothetical protein F1880_004536 [Penicillium rolfsii]